MKIKKNQSSTQQKKAKISGIELNEKLYPKDKNQILSESQLIKLEGFISIYLYLLNKQLDSRTDFLQIKSLGS